MCAMTNTSGLHSGITFWFCYKNCKLSVILSLHCYWLLFPLQLFFSWVTAGYHATFFIMCCYYIAAQILRLLYFSWLKTDAFLYYSMLSSHFSVSSLCKCVAQCNMWKIWKRSRGSGKKVVERGKGAVFAKQAALNSTSIGATSIEKEYNQS